jgi:AcrR family transcriptional regulator
LKEDFYKDRMPKTYHHGDLREAILSAGEILLRDKGVDGFSLRAVAKQAGVSPAAPAHHFENIKGIFSSLAARGFDHLTLSIRQRLENPTEAPIKALSMGYIEFAKNNPALFRLMFDCEKLNWEQQDLSDASQGSIRQLASIINGNTNLEPAEVTFYPEPVQSETLAVLGIMHGFAHLLVEDQLSFFAPDQSDLAVAELLMLSVLEKVAKRSTNE